MSESYAQRKSQVLAQARNLRKALRHLDAQVEVMQRAVFDLNNRKTIITPDSLIRISDMLTELNRRMDGVDNSFATVAQVAQSFL